MIESNRFVYVARPRPISSYTRAGDGARAKYGAGSRAGATPRSGSVTGKPAEKGSGLMSRINRLSRRQRRRSRVLRRRIACYTLKRA